MRISYIRFSVETPHCLGGRALISRVFVVSGGGGFFFLGFGCGRHWFLFYIGLFSDCSIDLVLLPFTWVCGGGVGVYIGVSRFSLAL